MLPELVDPPGPKRIWLTRHSYKIFIREHKSSNHKSYSHNHVSRGGIAGIVIAITIVVVIIILLIIYMRYRKRRADEMLVGELEIRHGTVIQQV